jgi:Domain of unknown function (DUF4280)
MAKLICSNAMAVCSGSHAGLPVRFSVLPGSGVLAGGSPAATVRDRDSAINIPAFGLCRMSTPPKPCVPAVAPAFLAGSATVLIANAPALDSASTLRCAQGGVISFQFPGQFSTEVP